jgi:hypothetical protein
LTGGGVGAKVAQDLEGRMKRSPVLAALAALVLASGAEAQQNDVKGWIKKPKAPVEAAPPAADPGAPKSISRGRGDPAPGNGSTPVVQPEPEPQPEPFPGNQAPAGQFLVATDPEAVQRVLLDQGMRADLEYDNQGFPYIVSEAGKGLFWIYFLDCESDLGCLAIEFYTAYEITAKVPADALNDFNAGYRYVRAYSADNTVSMAMDVLMRDGGIEVATFLEYLRLWTVILPDWEQVMGV